MSIALHARAEPAGSIHAGAAPVADPLVDETQAPNLGRTELRTTAAAFILALPALGLIMLVLWGFLLCIAWLVSALLGGSPWVFAAAAILLGIPGGWVSWRSVRLAIEAER